MEFIQYNKFVQLSEQAHVLPKGKARKAKEIYPFVSGVHTLFFMFRFKMLS